MMAPREATEAVNPIPQIANHNNAALIVAEIRRTPMNITELSNLARMEDAGFQEIDVPVSALKIDGDQIRVEGRTFNFGEGARMRVYKVLLHLASTLRN